MAIHQLSKRIAFVGEGGEWEYLKLRIYQAIALFTVTAKLHRKEKVIYAEYAGVSFGLLCTHYIEEGGSSLQIT